MVDTVVVGAGYASIACCSPSLMRLDVSANRLAVVDVPSLRGLDRLDQLDVADNPFDCARCRQTPFVRWLNRSVGVRLDRRDRLLCAEPPGPSVFDAAAADDCPYVAALPPHHARARSDPAGRRPGALPTALLATGAVGLAVALAVVEATAAARRIVPSYSPGGSNGHRMNTRSGWRWRWPSRRSSCDTAVDCFRDSSRCTACSTGRCATARCRTTLSRPWPRTIRCSTLRTPANSSPDDNFDDDDSKMLQY